MSSTKYINSEKNRKHERMSWKPDIGKWKTKRKIRKTMELGEKAYGVAMLGIVGAGGYAGYEGMKLRKFQNQQNALRRAAHMERFEQARNKRLNPNMVGGLEGQNIVQGGGGFGNLTQFGKGKELPKKNMKKGGRIG